MPTAPRRVPGRRGRPAIAGTTDPASMGRPMRGGGYRSSRFVPWQSSTPGSASPSWGGKDRDQGVRRRPPSHPDRLRFDPAAGPEPSCGAPRLLRGPLDHHPRSGIVGIHGREGEEVARRPRGHDVGDISRGDRDRPAGADEVIDLRAEVQQPGELACRPERQCEQPLPPQNPQPFPLPWQSPQPGSPQPASIPAPPQPPQPLPLQSPHRRLCPWEWGSFTPQPPSPQGNWLDGCTTAVPAGSDWVVATTAPRPSRRRARPAL